MIKLEEIKARHGKASRGPWFWVFNRKSQRVVLEATRAGYEIVMDFVRWGMGGATVRFRNSSDLMVHAKDLAVRVPGREHHESWHSTLSHPDADFIAHSWQDVKDLIEEVERLRLLVADLPRTADGVPVGPGMMVWVMPPKCANPGGFGWTVMEVTRTHVDGRRASEVYSTLPAAREAASREGAVKP